MLISITSVLQNMRALLDAGSYKGKHFAGVTLPRNAVDYASLPLLVVKEALHILDPAKCLRPLNFEIILL